MKSLQEEDEEIFKDIFSHIDLLRMIRGNIIQINRLTFKFLKTNNGHILDWLNENNIDYDKSYHRLVVVEFDDVNLAIEFKLRFM